MIVVSMQTRGKAVVEFGPPEQAVIREISKAYSIRPGDAIAAILNRGMDSIGHQVKAAEVGKTLKQLREDQDRG